MESIKELNKICQKDNYKTVGSWIDRYIVREIAICVTWLLLHTSITANQVTSIAFALGFAGVWLLAVPTNFGFLVGMLLMAIWYILDKADGQIARYRKTMSITGLFFDFVMHHVIHGILFFSLGLYLYQVTDNILLLVLSFVAALSIMTFNMLDQIKYATFFIKFNLFKDLKRVAQKDEAPKTDSSPRDHHVLRLIFSFFHKLCEIQVLLAILLTASVVQFVFAMSFDLRGPLIIFYAILTPVVASVKIAYIIKNQEVDKEFDSTFQLQDSGISTKDLTAQTPTGNQE